MSRWSRWTAQCTAVEPSGAASFGSAPLLSSERTALKSPFLAASTSAGSLAARVPATHRIPSATPINARIISTLLPPFGAATRSNVLTSGAWLHRVLVVEQQLPGAVAQLRDRHAGVI